MTAREITDFVNNDSTKISWTVNVKDDLSKNKELSINEGRFMVAHYRPFTSTHMFFSRRMNERVLQMPQIFPHEDAENLAICVTGRGNTDKFSCLIIKSIPDLSCVNTGQCFPRWLYSKSDEKGEQEIFDSEIETDSYGYVRKSAINENIVASLQKKWGGVFRQMTYSTSSMAYSMSLPTEKNTRQIYRKNFQEFPSLKMLNSSGFLPMQDEDLLNSMYSMKR